MSDRKNVVEFNQVLERELDEIVTRRRQANLSPVANGENARSQVSKDLVGLSLSGGGVRSASFSIGLIQALYVKGILRFVDYLSTVSGGGYAGSCLSSIALHPDTKFEWNVDDYKDPCTERLDSDEEDGEHPSNSESSEENFPLAPMADGRQPPRVVELIHGGNSLSRPLLFFNRYLIGVVLTNIVLMSALFMAAAAAAYLFRCLDYRPTIDFLYALGFRGDIWRAFFPSYVLLIVWLAMWAISYWRKGSQATGRYARWFLMLTFVSVLFAFAALLGTGDISMTYWTTELGIAPPDSAIHSVGKELKVALILLLLVALLPYLRIKDLIRSGTKPRNAVEGWIFAIASRALLFGLPLLVFAYFAHENISLHNEKRLETKHDVTYSKLYDLVPLEFKDWANTWRGIELEAAISRESAPPTATPNSNVTRNSASELFNVSREIWRDFETNPTMLNNLRESLAITKQIAKSDRDVSQLERWLQLFTWRVTGEGNEFSDQFDRRKRLVKLKLEICEYLTNTVIQDPDFFECFENIKGDFPERTDSQQRLIEGKIKALTLRGKGIQSVNKELIANPETQLGLDEWFRARGRLLTELTQLESENDLAAYREKKQELEALIDKAGGQYAKMADEVKQINWELLKTYFGEQLTTKDTVFAMVVVQNDQLTRLRWVFWSMVFFLVSSLVVSLNATSLHGFYRNRLSKTWITECPAFGRDIPLARMDTSTKGAPYHLLSGSLHVLGRNFDGQPPMAPFLFSRSFCGSDRTGFVATEEYAGGRYDLPNAMSISGAAVTPTQVQNPLLAALLLVANSRLGQWLPNPSRRRLLMPSWMEGILSRLPPSPLRLAIGWLQKPEARDYCFVADGGHTENLGLLELLRRRCKLIIVSDVSHDPEYQFQNYVELHRKVRSELGIRLKGIDRRNVDLQQAIPDAETGLAREHFVVARIIYPKEPNGSANQVDEGLLILIKPNFTGDEPIDLQSYRDHQPQFPHHPTTDQFYNPDRFESYRQLGFHIGAKICDVLVRKMCDTDQPGNALAMIQWPKDGPHSTPTEQNPNGSFPEKLTSDTLQNVMQMLLDDDIEQAVLAAHFIGESGAIDDQLRPTLEAGLYRALLRDEGNPALQQKVIWALGELHVEPPQIREHLLTIVNNQELPLADRQSALDCLAETSSNVRTIRRILKTVAKIDEPALAQQATDLLKKYQTKKQNPGLEDRS